MNTEYYTPEQYLEREREADYKNGYVQGKMSGMVINSTNHNRIRENTAGEVGIQLRGKSCRGFSDQRLHIPENGLYTYPDYMVVCGPNQYTDTHRDTIINPVMLVEILSKGTESYDRDEKFRLYRSIPTLREYVMIDSQSLRAEVFRKSNSSFWVLASEAASGKGAITLETIGLTLPMSVLYAETEGLLPCVKSLKNLKFAPNKSTDTPATLSVSSLFFCTLRP